MTASCIVMFDNHEFRSIEADDLTSLKARLSAFSEHILVGNLRVGESEIIGTWSFDSIGEFPESYLVYTCGQLAGETRVIAATPTNAVASVAKTRVKYLGTVSTIEVYEDETGRIYNVVKES